MKSVVLIVLDGYGLAPPGPGNAVYLANPNIFNTLMYSFPNTTLKASGEAVGLPPMDVGNTEVGHINLGAGRIVYQDFPRINMSIADGSFFKNQVFLDAIAHVKKTGGKLHFIGLVGEGFVHSSVEHLHSLLHSAKENGITQAFVHAITDGRDSPPQAAQNTIAALEEKMKTIGVGTIASVAGRYYAMDRDRRWERIEKAYVSLTQGSAQLSKTAADVISESYKKSITDEFIEPTNIDSGSGKPIALVEHGDAVIFFNFRIDRPRELTKAFVLDNFEKDANLIKSHDPYEVEYQKSHLEQHQTPTNPPFKRGPKIENLFFVTLTEYEKDLPTHIAYPPAIVNIPLSRVISEKGFHQIHMSESEKERFVTYYFNGLRDQSFPQEDHTIIPSPKVPTYDQKPEMSANELTNELIKKIREEKYQFILVNFANADMVGHTGSIEASIKAVKVLDECLDRITKVTLTMDTTVLITADHGNVEQKINPTTGQISTEHTSNPVPFIVVDRAYQGRVVKLQSGILADVAPTILHLLDILVPGDMTGRNLLAEL